MRSKTIIIILAVVLTLVLGALGFMVGLIMSSTKHEIVVQGDITENISELVAEIAITTEDTTTTVETTTITTTVTESETMTSVIETEKALDATYYRNYEPRMDKFVYNGIVATQSSDLNLRALPSENAEILSRIPKGQELAVYRTDVDGWYWTIYNRMRGYVCSQYITKSSGQQLEPVDHDERISEYFEQLEKEEKNRQPKYKLLLFTGYVATKSDDLNMRKYASSDSEVLCKIPKGTMLDIYTTGQDDWYWTEYKGQSGYVSSKYINQYDIPPGHEDEDVPAAGMHGIGYISPEQVPVYMYAAEDENSDILTTFAGGEEIILIRQNGDWISIQYNGMGGYVKAACVYW